MKKLFLLDMDGTIYLGERLFDGTADFLSWIRANGGQYAFLTNNSSRGIEGYLAKMERMGIPQSADNFLTSADATIDYLKKTYAPFAPGKKNDPPAAYYVCGTENLKGQLRAAGLKVLANEELSAFFDARGKSGEDGNCNSVAPPVVLLGYDTELTYEKLVNCVRLLDMGADYVSTHPDLVCPTENGNEPDVGLVIHSL